MGVSARIGTSNATGIVQPKVGDPNDLLLQYLPANTQANTGEYVVTSGTVASPDDSLYPPGARDRPGDLDQRRKRLQVGQRATRSANLHELDIVQVLTAAAGTPAGPAEQPRVQPACRPAGGAEAGTAGTVGLDGDRRMSGRSRGARR